MGDERPAMDPRRLLTTGDGLLPPCSHRKTIATYDHRTPPWVIAPPVGFTCLTCRALLPTRRCSQGQGWPIILRSKDER